MGGVSGGASSDDEDIEEQVEMLDALVLPLPSDVGTGGVRNALGDQEAGDRRIPSRAGDSAKGVGFRRCGVGVNGDCRISGNGRSGACKVTDNGGGSVQDGLFIVSRGAEASKSGVVTCKLGDSIVPKDSSLEVGLY